MNPPIPDFRPPVPNFHMSSNVWIIMKRESDLPSVEGVEHIKPIRAYFMRDRAEASLRHNEWVVGPIPLDTESKRNPYPDFPPRIPKGPKFVSPTIKLPKGSNPLGKLPEPKFQKNIFSDNDDLDTLK